MDNFSKGFLLKLAEFGFDGSSLLKEAQEEKPPLTDTYGGRTLLSAGIGSLAGLLYEAVKSKEKKKYWLRSALNGALGGAAAGALSLANRDMATSIAKKLVPEDETTYQLSPEVRQIVAGSGDTGSSGVDEFIAGINPDGTARQVDAKSLTSTARRQMALDEAERRKIEAKKRVRNSGVFDSDGQAAYRRTVNDYNRRKNRPMSFWETE